MQIARINWSTKGNTQKLGCRKEKGMSSAQVTWKCWLTSNGKTTLLKNVRKLCASFLKMLTNIQWKNHSWKCPKTMHKLFENVDWHPMEKPLARCPHVYEEKLFDLLASYKWHKGKVTIIDLFPSPTQVLHQCVYIFMYRYRQNVPLSETQLHNIIC